MTDDATRGNQSGHMTGGLTCVGAGQVVAGVSLFDDVLVDLRPLALRVAPEDKTLKLS